VQVVEGVEMMLLLEVAVVAGRLYFSAPKVTGGFRPLPLKKWN
jgi:hypothetical protein